MLQKLFECSHVFHTYQDSFWTFWIKYHFFQIWLQSKHYYIGLLVFGKDIAFSWTNHAKHKITKFYLMCKKISWLVYFLLLFLYYWGDVYDAPETSSTTTSEPIEGMLLFVLFHTKKKYFVKFNANCFYTNLQMQSFFSQTSYFCYFFEWHNT